MAPASTRDLNSLEDRSNSDVDVNGSTTNGEHIPKYDANGYFIREQPLGTKRKVRVVIMGAGASALNFFHEAETKLQNVDIVCYEKNSDVGGTWFENRYPGAACDIPSVNYQFTWKTSIWSHYYSYAPEIKAYFREIADEGDFVRRYIRLKHQISKAKWDAEAGLWCFEVTDLETGEVKKDQAEFFINAGGVLNRWKWPNIQGREKFKGTMMHTANFDESMDLKGKKVAVLGAGSSGVQCVAKIQKDVEQLYHWVKSPIWITAAYGGTWAGMEGANFKYSQEQRDFLAQNPRKYLEYKKRIEDELNQRFKFIIKGSAPAQQAREGAAADMRKKLASKPELAERIIPKSFGVGCRRPTPAPGYLEALCADNATVYTEALQEITEKGFRDSQGEEHEVDVFICATGFDTSWLPRFPLIANGIDLRDKWAGDNNITPYLCIGVPGFPNYWSYCGPFGPLAHGSFMPLIEQWTRYIFSAIEKMQIENIRSVTPQERAAQEFRQHADLFLQRTAWTSPCRSWFKQGKEDGQVTIWPGSRLHFLHMMESPRWEDYDIDYFNNGNRFSFMGNGFHTRESDGRDVTYYLGSLSEEGRDRQPDWDDSLFPKLAGWAKPEELF
ncbi:MAG: hypothetical protein M1828_002043 [Chrysothrix sp. TS-e1954]|nr:MAG: hypothetical protein M1828_002043 [Chrysothrix sp. TS-e1954]